MALPNDIEEILSDDYEEGEILEDDNLYEDVSSLEEFSCEESDLLAQGVVSVDLLGNNSLLKNHRKKEHKCKEDSLCRKERKGKHCYARIRKEKPLKLKSSDTVDHFFPDFNVSKKVDIIKVPSPPGRLRMDYVKPCRLDYKDYYEKENRNSNKKFWNSNEDLSRSRFKYAVEKPIDRGRTGKDYRSKHSNYSSSLSRRRSSLNAKFDSNKTSLLKRLVGSGISGVKTIKDDTSTTGSSVQSGDSFLMATVEPSRTESNLHKTDGSQDDVDNGLSEAVEGGLPAENVMLESAKDSTPDEQNSNKNSSAEPAEMKKKGIGLVWKRSIKDDRDELHLRVEALKSAWIKKFSDRKKRGLLNHKKSNGADDSLADFVLGSSSEDEQETITSPTPKFNAADLSGDILKPEDMVIVSTNDVSHQEPIILEPALQMGVPLGCESTVFVPSTLICLPDEEVTPREIGGCTDTAKADTTICEGSANAKNNLDKSLDSSKPHEPPKAHKSKSSLNETSYGSCSKNRKKRARRKAKKEAKRKSLSNSTELEEERILRENALMTLKIKSKPVTNSLPIQSSEEKIIDSKQVGPLEESALPSYGPKLPERESEVNGAISSDNLDDDIDEDILRAQLLSSLTKQVTGTLITVDSKPKIQNSNISTNASKKLEKKRFKNTVKKVWKNKLTIVDKKILNPDVKSKANAQQYPNNNKIKENRILNQVGAPMMRVSPIPQVPKFIISLNDSDSSSDMEFSNDEPERKSDQDPISKSLAAELEANIDLLLQEAKQNTKFGKIVPADPQNKISEPVLVEANSLEQITAEENQCVKDDSLINQTALNPPESNNSTPQALKHLPAWQQEEYRRLKQKIAEKEKVLEEVSRAKVVELEEQGKLREEPPRPALASDGGAQSSKENVIGASTLDTNQQTSDGNVNPDKKSFHSIASCSVMEEINLMNDIVNEFDKNNSEYFDLKKKLIRLTKLLKLTETKMSLKEKMLREMKENIQKKDRTISSRIDSLAISQKPPPEKNKPASRDMELIKLKYKEVSLRAQFLFHDFSTESAKPDGEKVLPRGQERGGLKRPAKPTDCPPSKKNTVDHSLLGKGKDTPELPTKRSFSVKERERGDWDPNTPVCHYDLTGICKDQECKYQHFKTV